MGSGGFKWFGYSPAIGDMTDMTVSEPVTISERAARRIGEILKTEGDGAMLRVSASRAAAAPAFSTSSTSNAPRPKTTS